MATDAFALFLVADKVHVALPALLMAGENMAMFGGNFGIFPYILLILTLLVAVAAHLHDLLHDILTSFLVPTSSPAHPCDQVLDTQRSHKKEELSHLIFAELISIE